MESDKVIKYGIFLLFTVGFILGYFYYHKYGWKPKGHLTETDKEFLTFTAYVSGVIWGFVTIAIGVMSFLMYLEYGKQ